MHVITRSCCSDAACVDVCPVNCIHPRPDEPGFATAEMLYIDPSTCVDCGACADVCPVQAIKAEHEVLPRDQPFVELNARYYLADDRRGYAPARPTKVAIRSTAAGHLRVAIVGCGPAACYAAENLVARGDLAVEVNIFERLPMPWGLVRLGVAPDHPDTKSASSRFERLAELGVKFHFNVEVGRHITAEELAAHHHAVVFAVGASESRRLSVPGADLGGVHSAQEFVAWYNGHPDFANRNFDLAVKRAVVIGNGNVALDVARILASPFARLRETDIADHALSSLATSKISEVVILARRGPAQSAYTTPELVALRDTDGIDVRVNQDDIAMDPDLRSAIAASPGSAEFAKLKLNEDLARAVEGHGKRVTLRYLTNPVTLLGRARVAGIQIGRNELFLGPGGRIAVRPNGITEEIECGLVLHSLGYAASPMPGLPFDADRGVIPNEGGRVQHSGNNALLDGTYVTGWIKRGATGAIGVNRFCAAETINALIDDYRAGALPDPVHPSGGISHLLRTRQPDVFGYEGWRAIDHDERAGGRPMNRPRRKLVQRGDLTAIAATARLNP
ncbi:FAD-dependent oxidoreductase [Mycobacterium paraintracellulare]|uniref:FAD-dependent oxidoreductase n=1 Tax=Mycobacterium paraintracellulare TaxID=1138383 RepID=UPI0038917498